ncbi:hypothetical protein BASA81_003048 [Batrachochytrium salamandrivorans]|nr:hypothetical protein BASA81_003048 [Batrachochytrium salamandrivorans]
MSLIPSSSSEHPLHTGHTIWLIRRQKTQRGNAGNKKKDEEAELVPSVPTNDAVEDWAKSLKKVATFHSVEGFWQVYGHMTRPSEMTASTDLHMFREGIKPVWEDPANKRGGKFHVKIRKGVLGSRYWESILLSVIGEQFGEYSGEICGVVISIRHGEDVLSLWTKTCDNQDMLNKIRDLFKRSLKLPSFVSIEFKRHDAHHQIDNSSSQPSSSTSSSANGGSGGGGPVWRNARS